MNSTKPTILLHLHSSDMRPGEKTLKLIGQDVIDRNCPDELLVSKDNFNAIVSRDFKTAIKAASKKRYRYSYPLAKFNQPTTEPIIVGVFRPGEPKKIIKLGYYEYI